MSQSVVYLAIYLYSAVVGRVVYECQLYFVS